MTHQSVLKKEAIDGLEIRQGDIFLDCTANGGGHIEEVCQRLGKSIKVIGLDLDQDALDRAKLRFKDKDFDITLQQSNFRNLDEVLDTLEISKVTKVLFDLGLSSNQLEESGRGFTFQKDEPLLMTFKKNPEKEDLTAGEIVNHFEEKVIADLLFTYGEERYARKIAKAIIEARKKRSIQTTFELIEIIKHAVPSSYQHGRTHFATKTFQAFRIAVNDEMTALPEALNKAFERLEDNGRIAVISFHSSEDRIVKRIFRSIKDRGDGTLFTKKPITPSEEEIRENPRSRSSNLRILIKNLSQK